MAMVIKADLSLSGKVYVKVLDAQQNLILANQADKIQRQTRFVGKLTKNLTGQYKIQNYHFCDEYRVSTENGVVSIAGDTITYTPAVEGSGGFTLNGSFYSIEILPEGPLKPSLYSPVDQETGVSASLTLISNSFDSEEVGWVHTATHWQLARNAEFTDLVVDDLSTTNLLTYECPQLDSLGVYYVRIRHVGELAE